MFRPAHNPYADQLTIGVIKPMDDAYDSFFPMVKDIAADNEHKSCREADKFGVGIPKKGKETPSPARPNRVAAS